MNNIQQSDLPCLDEQEASFREIETIHYPLKVYTLGHFSLVIDGSPLNFMSMAKISEHISAIKIDHFKAKK